MNDHHGIVIRRPGVKKLFAAFALSVFLLSGCRDKDIVKNYSFQVPAYYDKAIVRLADGGIVEGRLDNFYQSGSGFVVVSINGVKYCTAYTNVTLISTENNGN